MQLNLRRRLPWQGLWPRLDRAGLWPRRRWLFWAWDHLPAPIALRLLRQVDDLRGPAGGPAKRESNHDRV
jgi:hypothetical protein